MTETSNLSLEETEFQPILTEEEIVALFELPTRRIQRKVAVKPASKLRTSGHTLPFMVSSQRYRMPMRPSELRAKYEAKRKAENERRKAQREERKKAEMALTLVGLAILGELFERIKPIETVIVLVPSKPDEIITDAEFRDIIDDGDTKR